jgi:hypothetical protein
MKFQNETRYNGRELRRHISNVMRRMGVSPARYIIRVKYYARNNQRLQGTAWIGRPTVTLYMNRKEHALDLLYGTIEHELQHTLGLGHADIRGGCQVVNYEPMTGQTIKPLPLSQKPVMDKQRVRYSQALENLKRAATRLKRAATIEKKWRTKVRYYEHALAAAGKEVKP